MVKTHIEYDDFGEYTETAELIPTEEVTNDRTIEILDSIYLQKR